MPSRAIGRLTPDPTWKCPPGRPRTKWTDQLRRDNSVPIATLWRHGMTNYRKGALHKTTEDRQYRIGPTKDCKGTLRAKLQEIGTN